MSIFSTILADIENEALKIKDEIVAAAPAFIQTVETDAKAILSAAVPLAIGAVMDNAPLVLSGTEKFGSAVTSVIQQLEAKFGPVVVADIQTVVQMAYATIKNIANDL